VSSTIDFDELYESHFDRIFQYVLLRVANVAEAQDLTSQVFYKALRGSWWLRLRGGSVSAWLYRIATNEVNSHFRKQRVIQSHAEGSRREPSPGGGQTELETAESALARNRIHIELNRALRRLKLDEQALIVLRYFQDKSYGEIAEILGKREGALTMRTHRALGKLKQELERRGIDHEGFRESLAQPAEAGRPGGGVQAGFAR
jgi:RNA polymerase sigma-70 factor (ECF subfamily)